MAMCLRHGAVTVCFSDRSDGDFRIDSEPGPLDAARGRLAPGPWTWLEQVHGAKVVVVEVPGEHAGCAADAAVTATAGAVLAVQTADCVPVALIGSRPGGAPVIGVAHAGWRGAVAGVIGATVEAMREQDAEADISAIVGPCIAAASYEFGPELDGLVERFGPDVAGTTGWGTRALDMAALVQARLTEAGVQQIRRHDRDTATADDLYSHRARADLGRQTCAIWIAP